MNRRFPRQTTQSLTFEAEQGSGWLTHVDRIDHQQAAHAGDVRQQGQALRAAIQQHDIEGETRIALQPVYRMHADTIVRMDEIAQTKDYCLSHQRTRWSSDASIASRSSSSSSSTGMFL